MQLFISTFHILMQKNGIRYFHASHTISYAPILSRTPPDKGILYYGPYATSLIEVLSKGWAVKQVCLYMCQQERRQRWRDMYLNRETQTEQQNGNSGGVFQSLFWKQGKEREGGWLSYLLVMCVRVCYSISLLRCYMRSIVDCYQQYRAYTQTIAITASLLLLQH